VQIGKLRVKTDEVGAMLPQFYKGRDGKPAFAVDSFYDVLTARSRRASTPTRSC
jgi:serine/threonine-protein kinase